MDPGNSDCQPSRGRWVGVGTGAPPPEEWSLLLLPDALLELSLFVLCGLPSRFSPSASPLVLVLPPSCGLLFSAAACEALS